QSDPIANIPTGLSLREHQVKTFDAIRDPDIDVVFNTAMTGDGKSLAAYLPALTENKSILAMYPTNELIKDQERQVQDYCQWFGQHIDCDKMFSESLSELRTEFRDLRGQKAAIEYLALKNPILLTNPDIFNLIANFHYLNPEYENPDQLVGKIIDSYDLFVFDEFHIYDVSQVISVLTTMLYFIEQGRDKFEEKKFVFLSATPNPLLLNCLEKANLRYKIIDGCYQSGKQDSANWSRICAPFDLHFHATSRRTEEWVENHYQQIAKWFAESPNSRGAIIVNSVAAAKQICAFLKRRKEAGDFPLSIGENTGLSSEEERRFALHESDLLVGTSTVDVGVDFKINFLVFEGMDSGSWIQRLGRLGRHPDYKKSDGTVMKFDRFLAHSLLPKYAYERVEQIIPSTPEIDKETLIDLMRNEDEERRVFSPINDFRNYRKSWGWLHASHIINTLGHLGLRENYASEREKLTQIYSDIFETNIEMRSTKSYFAVKKKQPEIIEAGVIRFRGETPFTCGILDKTDGKIKDYNLLWVLQNTKVEYMEKADFKRECQIQKEPFRRFQYVDVYLRLHEYRLERESFQLRQTRRISAQFTTDKHYRQLHTLKGFEIDGNFPEINKINRWLRVKPLLCLIRQEPVHDLRRILRLPAMFSIFPLIDPDGNNKFSIVFSKDALLLYSQPYIRGGKENTNG
ncbi:type I-D CRISPR-associated helicase Cas3', partial [Candidatus Poribacteria bacterium]|nr:type I-D CRISPR-associated helicase Cas3' [Candidatus Poribacteria bacterium]